MRLDNMDLCQKIFQHLYLYFTVLAPSLGVFHAGIAHEGIVQQVKLAPP